MSDSNTTTLKLPSTMTIGECHSISHQMVTMLAEDKVIDLNASEVEKIDAAGMQLLLSFIVDNDKKNMQGQFEFSESIIESAKLLGVIDFFNPQ